MIDTIRIESPELTLYQVQIIESQLIAKMAIDMKTGEQLYRFTSDSLKGSYDSRIMIKIDKNKYNNNIVIIEGSVHKNLLGQNAVGMTDNYKLCVYWFVGLIEEQFNVRLPSWKDWIPRRIDFAKVFDLDNSKNVSKYINGLTALTYPRRKVDRHEDESIYIKGSTSVLKFYNKGLEFKVHDYNRLKRFFKYEQMIYFLEIVNKLLRVEVEIKWRLIKSKYGDNVTCNDIELHWLQNIFEDEIYKFLKEGDSVRIVRTSEKVKERLIQFYNKRLASILYGTWFILTTHGESEAKELIEQRTYRRHIKQLKEAGISWHNTNLHVDKSILEFIPSLNSDKIVNWIHEDCIKLLNLRKIA